MNACRRRLILTVTLLTIVPLLGQPARMDQGAAARRPLELEDVIAWRTIGATALSNDGQWFAYRVGSSEGDAQVVVRNTQSGKEQKFAIGDPLGGGIGAAPAPGAPAADAAPSAVMFSDDSKWLAFASFPMKRDADRLRHQRRPVQGGVTIVNLATGDKREYARVRRFAFSGEAAGWIAILRRPDQAVVRVRPLARHHRAGAVRPQPTGRAERI
jgi:hypothetical protein